MRPTLLLILCLFAFQCFSAKLEPASKDSVVTTEFVSKPTVSDFKLPGIRELQVQAGRKLTFKERLAYYFVKSKFRNADPLETDIKNANSNAVLGFVFSCLALFVVPLFAIPALILSGKALRTEKVSPGVLTRSNKSLARAGQIISYVALALLLVALLIILAFVGALGGR